MRRCRWWLSANGYLIRIIVIKWAGGLSTLALDARRARASFDACSVAGGRMAMLRRCVERRLLWWLSANGYIIKAIVLKWARDGVADRRARAKAIALKWARVCFHVWLSVWRLLRLATLRCRRLWFRSNCRLLKVILWSWPGRLPDQRTGWNCGYEPTTAWDCYDVPTPAFQDLPTPTMVLSPYFRIESFSNGNVSIIPVFHV